MPASSTIPIAYVRIHEHRGPADVSTYAAVRTADLPALLSESDAVITLEDCELVIPQEVAGMTAAQLAAPLLHMTVIIGTVAGGAWVTGPLAGEPAPPQSAGCAR